MAIRTYHDSLIRCNSPKLFDRTMLLVIQLPLDYGSKERTNFVFSTQNVESMSRACQ